MAALGYKLFRSHRSKRDISEFASRLELRVVDMPVDHETLTRLLQEMLA